MNYLDFITANGGYWSVAMFSSSDAILSFIFGTMILGLIAYIIGSINAGQILSMFGNKNLGAEGSKSFGATNAGRVYGKWAFILVFLFDMFKAVFAALILWVIIENAYNINQEGTSEGFNLFLYANVNLAMIMLIVGHCWPIFFKFKGGKGVAAAFGSVIILNWVFAIIAIVVFIIVKLVNGWTSNASIIGTSVGVILILAFHWTFLLMYQNTGVILVFPWSLNWTAMIAAFVVGFIIIVRHWPNIQQMINGEKPWKRIKEDNEKQITTNI